MQWARAQGLSVEKILERDFGLCFVLVVILLF